MTSSFILLSTGIFLAKSVYDDSCVRPLWLPDIPHVHGQHSSEPEQDWGDGITLWLIRPAHRADVLPLVVLQPGRALCGRSNSSHSHFLTSRIIDTDHWTMVKNLKNFPRPSFVVREKDSWSFRLHRSVRLTGPYVKLQNLLLKSLIWKTAIFLDTF